MARTPNPWFWEERNGWYVTKDGIRHFLGDRPPDSPVPKKTKGKWNAPDGIRQEFHSLLAKKPEPTNTPSATGFTLGELFEKYLEWCQKHRAVRTYDGYVWHIQAFCDHLKTAATTPAL
ncbi:MAG TPA: hypothetical protein VN641_01650, partial [Urbifossiella sp.]|nr:hypothetical protein [Urbifossiella sp.]